MPVLSLVLVLAAAVAALVLVLGLVRPATFKMGRRRAGLVLGPVIGVLAIAALVLFAMPQYQVARASTDEPVVCGESSELLIEVKNDGLVGGTYCCAYSLDGAQQTDVELPVDGGASEVVGLPLPSDLSPGEHTATVGGTTLSFMALRPAKFVVEWFDVHPTTLKIGEKIKVYAKVSNSGEVPGTFDGRLYVDGKVKDRQPTEVQPGEAVQLVYTYKPKSAGRYDVKVANKRDKVLVVQPIRLVNGQVIERDLGSGSGELEVDNKENKSDAVVVLTSTSSRKPLLAVYVRAKDSCLVYGIPAGKYHVYFSVGRDWNRQMRGFLTTEYQLRAERPLEFSWSGYMGWTIYPYTVYGGTEETRTVSQGDFPKVD
jgi:hypothetical protein